MSAIVGRNDPCPCGSGKKHKVCCRHSAEAPRTPAQTWHDLDDRLMRVMGTYARRRFQEVWARVLEGCPVDVEADPARMQIVAAWMFFEHKIQGRTVVDHFLEDRGRNLLPAERGWLEAQPRAWLSVWEVESVEPGVNVSLRDLLTEERRTVTEAKGSLTLDRGLLLLARVVDHAGFSLLCGSHPNPLRPLPGARAVADIRAFLEAPKRIQPARLRQDDTPTRLLQIWQNIVAEEAARPMPSLANMNGEALVFVNDVYTYTTDGARAEVERVLAAQSDVESPGPGQKTREYAFVRPAQAPEVLPVTIGRVRPLARELRVQTNSRERADALRERLDGLCAGLIRHKRRTEDDVRSTLAEEAPAAPRRAPAPLEGPEIDAVVLDYKRKHYATWPDYPLPALDDLTPREAARDAKLRARLVALLKDMELSERAVPAGQRFDVDELRRALGLAE